MKKTTSESSKLQELQMSYQNLKKAYDVCKVGGHGDEVICGL